jgi:hypothetical protein
MTMSFRPQHTKWAERRNLLPAEMQRAGGRDFSARAWRRLVEMTSCVGGGNRRLAIVTGSPKERRAYRLAVGELAGAGNWRTRPRPSGDFGYAWLVTELQGDCPQR